MPDAKHVRLTAAAAGLVTILASWSVGPPPARAATHQPAYAELPIAFTENRGQLDERVRYYAQRAGSALFFTDDAIVMRAEQAALALRFVGSNPEVAVIGDQGVPGRVHYLRGNDPAGWQTGIPRFANVVYLELWPGIDLVLRAGGAELKYEFRVRPGAHPSDIRLAYAGADGLSLERDGALRIRTAAGPLRDSAPVSWQVIDGARVPVESRYLLVRGNTAEPSYGFALGAFDPDQELIIDPGLDYSTFLGGSSMDRGEGLAVDSAGNTYVVGTTQSTDFPTTTGAIDRTFSGGTTDVFVAKLDATGSGLVYATYLGGVPTPLRRGTGDNVESGRAIAVDADGHAYVTGRTDSSDFPTTSGAFQPALNATLDNATDAFVTKLTPSGSGLMYSTFLGGTSFDDGWSIALDAAGNAYVTGDTGSIDFPVTAGAAQTSRGGGRDAFVAKLNAAGSALVYGTYLGGTDNEVGNGVAVDAAGDAYVAGGTRSADFPTTAGAFQPVHSGGAFADLFDAFAVKLNGTGALVYSTFLGGTKLDIANGVAVDAGANAYVVGSTSSPEFPTTAGAFDTTSSGGFVTKLSSDGSNLVYSTFLGGGGRSAITLDSGNNAWIVGTASAGAPVTADAFASQSSGGSDAWLGQLNLDGSAIAFATFFGGINTDNGNDLAIDGNGSVYIAGVTMSSDFPTTSGAFDNTFSGDPTIFWGDAFVAKFGAGGGTVVEPAPSRTTASFSGELDKNSIVTHTVEVGAAGPVDLSLDWDESRSNLTLRVRNGSGLEVFFDGSTAKPKEGSFDAAAAGSYHVELRNTTNRQTDYTLSVTYPVEETSTSVGVSFLSLDPTSVEGGSASTGRVSLNAAAPPGGAAVTLTSSNTAAATVPESVTIPEGLSSATFTVSTSAVTSNTESTISATYNGTTRSATLTVNAPGGPAMSSLTLDPTVVSGGSPSTGTATLTGAAPAGGAVVTLGSSNTAVATVPDSVTVPGGELSATFTISTLTQEFDQSSAISASHGGVTRSAILSVTPGATAALSSLSLSPTSVTGGAASTGTVTLSAAAPAGGLEVTLSSSNAAATVPSSVTVSAGSTSATFGISTSSVAASTDVTITAGAGGVTKTATLTVSPGGANALLTVTATGRGGETIFSSPAGISVNVGSTGSASFPEGTSITLSVSDERDAIWSGACSSGGEKTKTCTFTLNADASVSAEVR